MKSNPPLTLWREVLEAPPWSTFGFSLFDVLRDTHLC